MISAPQRHSFLYNANAFIVSRSTFNEYHYFETYWINKVRDLCKKNLLLLYSTGVTCMRYVQHFKEYDRQSGNDDR